MGKNKKKVPPAAAEQPVPQAAEEAPVETPGETPGEAPAQQPPRTQGEPAQQPEETPSEAEALLAQLEQARSSLAQAEEKFLRLAAEYDNFRKRTKKEKDGIWNDAAAAAVTALLPVYDNLERALKQETTDAAYKKGVEMTMTGLKDALVKLGVETVPALGETFDPKLHNAVMHCEDAQAGENTVVEVFQQGFQLGDKVLRFAMVKVAN